MVAVWIPWLIFAACILAVIVFNYAVVAYYSSRALSRNEEERKDRRLPMIVTVFGLSLTLFCVLLIPIDIFSVSNDFSYSSTEELGKAIKIVYYVLYSLVLAFVFGVIPFTYFFYEEYGEDVTIGKRIFSGCKYTIFLVLFVAVLFIIGLFVQGGSPDTDDKNYKEYVEKILDTENRGDSAIVFALACATLLGFIVWCTYTAFGLSLFPVGWIKGYQRLDNEEQDIETHLMIAREKRRAITSRYSARASERRARGEEQRLGLLRDKERELVAKKSLLDEQKGCCGVMCRALTPFKFLFGIAFFLVSVLIVVALILTSVDRVLHSECGLSCGYTLTHPTKWLNPLDTLLTYMSKYFPVDYVLMVLLVLFIYFATLAGIVHIGIRFLWISLYKVRAHASRPQGLLLATAIMMFSLLALNMEVMTMAPQYLTYGSQTYTNDKGESVACDLSAPHGQGNCTMTQIGTIVNRINMKMTFFGVVFYFATWAFVACFLIGFVVAIFRKKPSNVEVESDNEFEDF